VIETLALRDVVSCVVDRNFDRVRFEVNCAELVRLREIRLDRLNTKDMMSRKNFHVGSTKCVLCDDSADDTTLYLFFSHVI
jgi:hypothetical protein